MVMYASAHEFILEQGMYIMDTFETLEPEYMEYIKSNVANLFAGLYEGFAKVLAVRDSDNIGCGDELPPVLPHRLVETKSALRFGAPAS